MLTIYVLGKSGAPMFSAVDGRRSTISIGLPGTFPPLPEGPDTFSPKEPPDKVDEELEPAPEELEKLADYVAGWDALLSAGATKGPEMECSRSLVMAVLRDAPWIRRQVEKAVENLNRRTFVH